MSALDLPSTLNPFPRRVSVPLKFLAMTTAATIAWLFALAEISDVELITGEGGDAFQMMVVMSLSGAIAAAVYFQLPGETVDIYHRFGKASALYLSLNVVISVALIAIQWSEIGQYDPFLWDLIAAWVSASVLVPGPYLGAVIAARWSR